MSRPSKPWFEPKAYGYGAGLPIAWQGWLLSAAFVGGMVAAGVKLEGPLRLAVMAGLVVAFVLVALAKTEGGWRWRWGSRR